MRHSQAGKCVVPGRRLYDKSWGVVDLAELKDRCLDDDAQFYYTNTKLLRNRKQKGTFLRRGTTYLSRFVLYYGRANGAITVYNDKKYILKQTTYGSLEIDGYCADRISNKNLDESILC